jgi:hypothetical protein
MAAVGVVQVHCPECDVAVPIATEITARRGEGNTMIMIVEPDLADAVGHAWTHDPTLR